MFSANGKIEAKPASFKRRNRRKRTVPKVVVERVMPTSLEDINDGLHRGCRDVVAFAACLSEFEQARASDRDVSVDRAASRMLTDPFSWGDTVSNRLFVLWKAVDGHHCDAVSMRSLMQWIATPREV